MVYGISTIVQGITVTGMKPYNSVKEVFPWDFFRELPKEVNLGGFSSLGPLNYVAREALPYKLMVSDMQDLF